MHEITAEQQIIIGGFAKSLADVRRFVRLADQHGIPDTAPLNAVLQLRWVVDEKWTS